VIVPRFCRSTTTDSGIKRAQRIAGMPKGDQINPGRTVIHCVPRQWVLVIQYFLHFWYAEEESEHGSPDGRRCCPNRAHHLPAAV